MKSWFRAGGREKLGWEDEAKVNECTSKGKKEDAQRKGVRKGRGLGRRG